MITKRILHWLLPQHCVLCQRINPDFFCSGCLCQLPWLTDYCQLCATQLPLSADNICGECLIDPPPLQRSLVLFKYEFPVVSLITQLKFRRKLFIASALGQLLANKILTEYQNDDYPDCVIPVPLHPERLRARGYNQALEISKPIRRLGIPIDYRQVTKIVPTPPQSLTDLEQRKKNVANVFHINPNFDYHHVALVDDVVTTGSTVNELARMLRNHGVARIDLWYIAKTGLK